MLYVKIKSERGGLMETYNDCLLKVPVFETLDESILIEISKLIKEKHYQANEIIYREGDLIEDLGIIHKGSVKLVKTSIEGKQRIISLLLSGEYFGETSLLVSQKTEYEVVALETTSIHYIDLKAFRKIILTNEAMTLSILQSLIDQISKRDQAVVNESLIPAYDRVYDALLHYSDLKGLVDLPISKKDLANSLGITPETFSRSLNRLEKDQKISRTNSAIFIV